MAILVAAPSAVVSVPANSPSRASHSITGSRSVRGVGGQRSGFLGDSLRSHSEFRSNRKDDANASVVRGSCLVGRGGSRGRVFLIPFGAGLAGRRRHGGSGTFAGQEWEKRCRTQQERLREMVEREMKGRQRRHVRSKEEEKKNVKSEVETKEETKEEEKEVTSEEETKEVISKEKDHSEGEEGKKENDISSNYGYSLLRELEKTWRAEKKKYEEAAAKSGSAIQDELPVDETQGAKGTSEQSTYDLMKELERRLRAERTSSGSRRENRERPRESSRESPRERGQWMTGNFTSLYDFMREYGREMHEDRARLEEVWRSREGGRRWREGRRGEREETRTSRKDESSSVRRESELEAADNTEKTEDTEAASSAADAPKYPQSNGTVVYLKNEANGAEIYLVGTSHVSSKSADEVREVIERVKPDMVMVELCRKRYEGMKLNIHRDRSGKHNNPMTFVEQMVRMLSSGNVGAMGELVGIALSGFYRLLSRGHPGREFQVAIEEGKNVGAKIVLGDQDIDTTLKKLGNFNLRMTMENAFKFFGQRVPNDMPHSAGEQAAFSEMFEKMQDRQVIRRFNEEMEKGAPVIYKVLLTERNEVMTKALRNLKGKVVAVVGLAHMDGMEQLWHQANEKYFTGQ